jgi:hypothetical protein
MKRLGNGERLAVLSSQSEQLLEEERIALGHLEGTRLHACIEFEPDRADERFRLRRR